MRRTDELHPEPLLSTPPIANISYSIFEHVQISTKAIHAINDSRRTSPLQDIEAFEDNPDLTQRELAEQLGLSLGRTNCLVNALMDKGSVTMKNFRRPDTKLKKIAYILTPSGKRDRIRLTEGYLARKKVEYEALKAEIEALEKESLNTNAMYKRTQA